MYYSGRLMMLNSVQNEPAGPLPQEGILWEPVHDWTYAPTDTFTNGQWRIFDKIPLDRTRGVGGIDMLSRNMELKDNMFLFKNPINRGCILNTTGGHRMKTYSKIWKAEIAIEEIQFAPSQSDTTTLFDMGMRGSGTTAGIPAYTCFLRLEGGETYVCLSAIDYNISSPQTKIDLRYSLGTTNTIKQLIIEYGIEPIIEEYGRLFINIKGYGSNRTPYKKVAISNPFQLKNISFSATQFPGFTTFAIRYGYENTQIPSRIVSPDSMTKIKYVKVWRQFIG